MGAENKERRESRARENISKECKEAKVIAQKKRIGER